MSSTTNAHSTTQFVSFFMVIAVNYVVLVSKYFLQNDASLSRCINIFLLFVFINTKFN
jgi:hypothetical protein